MTLGERMKMYEMQSRTRLLRRTPVIIRIDGKAFHTFTRGLDKPFDLDFIEIMQKTMLGLCEEIEGCVLGYTQSDEITLVLIDYKDLETQAWFDNQVQKMTSVGASIATRRFEQALYYKIENEIKYRIGLCLKEEDMNKAIKRYKLFKDKQFKASFDARAFNLPIHEVCNNLIWRQQDATRNSILSCATELLGHKNIQGLKCNQLQNKMLIEKDFNWNNLSIDLKRGSCCIKIENGWIVDKNIPIFTENKNYVNDKLYIDNL